mmetsp:Transcript_11433/g.15589  ORF Transcript_11433/g.15589 Transcript_11433/m.15589 type:complete len:180 (+) Transcript_11433:105-644(+)|eukprot:CAMPEP_0196598078 /NCGR_PEP_ID=MMETSP1081-20130531/94106_1 /TAXON_ID=36882 /ORGANISM="Pyramimonas amylifera, Strain CCMP720" /LENGTH=179 /DNA_ID=CAMNT_0041923713 /DNA_START=83 /DNA_END=622 /DNA_ORIENTATION=-
MVAEILSTSPFSVVACVARSSPVSYNPTYSMLATKSVRMPQSLRMKSAVVQPLSLSRASSKNSRKAFKVSAEITPEFKEGIEKFLVSNKIVLFMKGTKQFPQCGFSNTTVQILNTFGVPYETVNILEDDQIRQGMKEYSAWPTFPQVYIDGEFFGGCDILIESYQNGGLQEEIEKAMSS